MQILIAGATLENTSMPKLKSGLLGGVSGDDMPAEVIRLCECNAHHRSADDSPTIVSHCEVNLDVC